MKIKNVCKLFLALFFTLLLAKGYSQTTTATVPAPATTATPVPANTATTVAANTVPNVPAVPGSSNDGRPSGTTGVVDVDNYVTNCYNLNDQTNSISSQLNAVEKQVMVKKTSDLDVNAVDAQMSSFNTQLLGLRGDGLQLAQSGSAMTSNAVSGLKNKPFKIPVAVIRVKNATKTANSSLKSINTMLTVTMVNIKNKLHPNNTANTAQNNPPITSH